MFLRSIFAILAVSSLSASIKARETCCPKPCEEEKKTTVVCCDENHVFTAVDFIYWYAKQEGNDYASTGNAITVPGTVDPNTGLTAGSIGSGSLKSPQAKMAPGFKAALGCTLAHDKWEVFAEYTYLHTSATGSVASGNLNAGIIPIFSYSPHNSILASTTFAAPAGATGFVSSSNAHWLLHFNNVNLELGKEIRLSPRFLLHPHFGLQGSWQKQHLTANYEVSSFTAPSIFLGKNKITYHQDFWGLGLRGGVDGTWEFCDHWGLFADTGFSALWGQFKTRAKSYDTNVAAGYSNRLIANQSNTPHSVIPVIQLMLGLQTDWNFAGDYRFLFKAGWEAQVWFFQNQHSSVIADTSLIMQGLTLVARFDF